eukprot:TRINITY_DN7239_c0_g2_i4.p1 TRINITY_DN7239_c0_g2~~TRINITY_DN7239_c0_g2_i4.p1  ORF type:complete len:250 (+),score=36.95 TRINITY_DN7239_c0_g2_i4:105-854(+)
MRCGNCQHVIHHHFCQASTMAVNAALTHLQGAFRCTAIDRLAFNASRCSITSLLRPHNRTLHTTTILRHWNSHHTEKLRQDAIASHSPIPIEADPKQTVYYSRRNIQGSPWKVNLVARQIRGLAIDDAIVQTQFSHKKAAEQINQVLRIAKQNAKVNNGIEDNSNLYVLESFVGKGVYGRNIRRANKGRGYHGKRRKAHYYLKLRYGPPPKPEKKRNNYKLQTTRVIEELNQYPPKIRTSLEAGTDVPL